MVAAVVAGLAAPMSSAMAQFASPSYNSDKSFNNATQSTTMTLAWDGSSYWSTSGGGTGGQRLARYDASGTLLGTFAPGLDFRSIFADASGQLYARQYADPTIYIMNAPGVFSSMVSLSGGTLDAQSSVVFNGAGTEYIAMVGGIVNRWSLTGANLGSTSLVGFGSMGNEGSYPQYRGIASLGVNWVTYSDGTLSMWDTAGNRLGTTTLNGGGSGFDAHFSLSNAGDGRVFVVDDNGPQQWQGFLIESSAVVATPEPASMTLLATGLVGVIGFARRRRKAALAA